MTAFVLNIPLSVKWISVISLSLLMIWVIYSIYQKHNIDPVRKRIKIGLHILLWIGMLLFIFPPKKQDGGSILVYSSGSDKTKIREIKDSLKISKAVSYPDFKKDLKIYKDKKITLLGQEIDSEILSGLNRQQLYWIPDFPKDSVQSIHWQAFPHYGSEMEIKGTMETDEDKMLKIALGNTTLDSLILKKGLNNFKLSFPVLTLGKNELSLSLGQKEIYRIHYFSYPGQKPSVLILQDYPNFETKTLADELGKQGYPIKIITKIAKDAVHESEINLNSANFRYNLIITNTQNISDKRVKQAISDGKDVLIMGLDKPESEIPVINRTFGTQFQVERISNSETVSLGNHLETLPYRFFPKPTQKLHPGLPIAYQQKVGKIAVSLLNETFPVKLNGDSLSYRKTWTEIMNIFQMPDSNKLHVKAPVFRNISKEIHLNPSKQSELFIGKDTLRLGTSPINPFQKRGVYMFSDLGWQKINDSIEIYVEPFSKTEYLKAELSQESSNQKIREDLSPQAFSEWIWYLLILTILGLIWVEPKV